MTEQEPDVEAVDNSLFVAGEEAGIEKAVQALEEQGYDREEAEALFDPAPRRGRRSRVHHRRKAVRVYDPVPKKRKSVRYGKRKVTAKRHGKKSLMNKLKPYIMPAVAGVTVYGGYVARADELFKSGLITSNDVITAITYDLTNIDSTAAWERLSSSEAIGAVGVPVIAGIAAKEFVGGSMARMVGDALTGYGIGTAVNYTLGAVPAAVAMKIRSKRSGVSARSQIVSSTCGQTQMIQRQTNGRRMAAVAAYRQV